MFLLDGPVLLAEALRDGAPLQRVYTEVPEALPEELVGDPRVRLVVDGTLAAVLDLVTPRPVVAEVARTTTDAADVVAAAAGAGAPVLVLVEVADPGNAGTLVRAAEAAGCGGVLVSAGSVDVLGPKAVRASAGSVLRVPLAEEVPVERLPTVLGEHGVRLVATVGSGGSAPERADLAGTVAVAVGSESHGLPPELAAVADVSVTVPMAGRVESLNAGVAGAVVLFEAARQRRSSHPDATGSGPAAPVGHNEREVPRTVRGPLSRGERCDG